MSCRDRVVGSSEKLIGETIRLGLLGSKTWLLQQFSIFFG